MKTHKKHRAWDLTLTSYWLGAAGWGGRLCRICPCSSDRSIRQGGVQSRCAGGRRVNLEHFRTRHSPGNKGRIQWKDETQKEVNLVLTRTQYWLHTSNLTKHTCIQKAPLLLQLSFLQYKVNSRGSDNTKFCKVQSGPYRSALLMNNTKYSTSWLNDLTSSCSSLLAALIWGTCSM